MPQASRRRRRARNVEVHNYPAPGRNRRIAAQRQATCGRQRFSRRQRMTHPTRRQVLTAAAAAATTLALPAIVRAQAPIVIKFSHVVAPDTPKGNGAQRFKELAEKNTGG